MSSWKYASTLDHFNLIKMSHFDLIKSSYFIFTIMTHMP